MIRAKIELSESVKRTMKVKLNSSESVRFTFKRGLQEIVEHARANHKFITRTENLVQSIDSRLLSDKLLSGEIYINDDKAPYGKWQHDGTRDHKIAPKNKKMLRWVFGSDFRFSKGVTVKGIKPDPFVEKAIKEKIGPFAKKLSDAMMEEFNK